MASPDQSRKVGGSLLRSEDFMPLPLALAVGHVYSHSPKDEEDVLYHREAAGVPVTTVLLGLAILRGSAAAVFLDHVALLEGVVDWCLMVWAWLLQHVVEHAGASRGRSRALSGRVDREGLLTVKIRQPSHEFTFGVGISFIPYPLVLTPVV
jgi:hypothetical protein